MRLNDDEIRAMRDTVWERPDEINRAKLIELHDEIEELRRIDARRLADAEQAFRE